MLDVRCWMLDVPPPRSTVPSHRAACPRRLFDPCRCGQGVAPDLDRLLILLRGLLSILPLRHGLLNEAGLATCRRGLAALERSRNSTAGHQHPEGEPSAQEPGEVSDRRGTPPRGVLRLASRVLSRRLWIADGGLRTADSGLRTVECGLRISDFSFRVRFHSTRYRSTNPVTWVTSLLFSL